MRRKDVAERDTDGHDFGDFEALARALTENGFERAPMEQLHDEKDAPVFCDIVVEHLDGAGLEAVRDVALAHEALAHLLLFATSGWRIFTAPRRPLRWVAA